MVIDETIPNIDISLDEEDVTDFIEDLESDFDVDLSFTKDIPNAQMSNLINAIMTRTIREVSFAVEIERGEVLVVFVDNKFADKSDKEMEQYWDMSSKDEYTKHNPEQEAEYRYNLNGKTRPIWYGDNSWQNDKHNE